jgi:pimeloyl-ACP methyl ester carboxylesterase
VGVPCQPYLSQTRGIRLVLFLVTCRRVLAVDLRGMGETATPPQRYFDIARHGANGQDAYLAYLLGLSLAGMQADDVVPLRTEVPTP